MRGCRLFALLLLLGSAACSGGRRYDLVAFEGGGVARIDHQTGDILYCSRARDGDLLCVRHDNTK